MASSPPRSSDTTELTPRASTPDDVILPHARTEDGEGLHVLRKRGDVVEAGTIRAMREGQPLHGELVSLAHREGTPLFDVSVLHDARPASARGRPPKVATRAFRDGWDRIFSKEDPGDEEPS
ncbi:MAG: hypothetical protein J0L92_07990 [Deltaproteobacteria bacterium]|nr:hypothetical protein [Deltaproteobacteria bacterium]